jgi:hypothetical protein
MTSKPPPQMAKPNEILNCFRVLLALCVFFIQIPFCLAFINFSSLRLPRGRGSW